MIEVKKSYILDITLKLIIAIFSLLFLRGNIVCNDGTVSPSCGSCRPGCCSHHGGCTSTPNTYNNHYSSGQNNYYQNSKNEESSDFTAWAVILVLGVPVLIGIFGEKTDKKPTTTNSVQKSGYELFCDKVDNYNERTTTKNNIIGGDTRTKYDDITFIYKNSNIRCTVYSKNDIEAYHSRNSYNTKFRNLGRLITMHNKTKSQDAYILYNEGVFDYELTADCYASDVEIYDPNKSLRRVYDFKSDTITTGNIARSKKTITNFNNRFLIIFNKVNYSKRFIAYIDYKNLVHFSKLCQSIKIIEKERGNEQEK